MIVPPSCRPRPCPFPSTFSSLTTSFRCLSSPHDIRHAHDDVLYQDDLLDCVCSLRMYVFRTQLQHCQLVPITNVYPFVLDIAIF